MPNYLLGIDNGGTVAKAALFTTDGQEIAVASRKTEMLTPHPGHTERDVEKMWQATAQAIREVLEKSKVDPDQIACVAPTGHGNGLYLVDKAGVPVRDGIVSTDSRAKDYIARWQAEGVGERLLPKTTQCLWPAQPGALLAWIRDNEPEVMQRAGWILMCKDYIRFRLTGKIEAELTDMSGTGLMSVVDADYDMEVLEALGLADMRDLMPPLVRSEEIRGQVTAAAAADTGLKEGTPVAGGMFDIDACALASGIVNEQEMSLIAGTWGNNQYISKEPLIDKDLFMTSCFAMPGYYLMLEGSATSASNLEWFVTEFFEAERENVEAQGKTVYELCSDLVGSTEPEESDIVFLPFIYGSNADPDAKASFIGINSHHKREHILRAIFEGVVFSHRAHIDRLLQFRPAPRAIRFTGGAARSQVWVQIFADALGLPIEIPAGTELGALGAAIAAAVASGQYPGYVEAVETMAKTSRVQQPNPEKKTVYDAKYARYKKVIEALGTVWKEL